MKKLFTFLIFFSFYQLSFTQGVLVEEFTNIHLEEASEQSRMLDSLLENNFGFCIIRYHTDQPAGDPFNESVTDEVADRIRWVGGIDQFPTTVVDGDNLARGDSFDGATANISKDYLDSIYFEKDKKINFFGLGLNFSEDYREVFGSSGMTTIENMDLNVKHYRALVEKVIDSSEPLGPDGQTKFHHVFRGWIYVGNDRIPGNGSIHGWSRFTLPSTIVDLNQLHMVVFATDLDGKVLDCAMVEPEFAPSYALKSTNITVSQNTLCDSLVVPGIRIKNTGVNPIEGVAIKTTIGDSSYIDFRSDVLQPAESADYYLGEREILLSRGTHYIDVTVDYILNAPVQGSISESNGPIRYLVGRAHDMEDVGFEDMPEEGFGPIIVRAKVDEALRVVDAEDIGADQPIGAYGESEHSLMVDLWNWDWDEEDAGNIYKVDNKNFAYLYFDHFSLEDIGQPVLEFDVASANKPNHKCIEISGRPFTCTRNPRSLKTYTGNDILSTAANTSSRYIPKPQDWKSYSLDLNYLKDSKQTHLRFKFTNHVDYTRPNAFYIDNIRIVDAEKTCTGGDILLSKQAALDSFLVVNPDCNTIDGDLCIGAFPGDSLSDITDLQALKNINSIKGDFKLINNPRLKDISALSKLREVLGNIEIINNDSLVSFEALTQLTTAKQAYIVRDNKVLSSVPYISTSKMNGSVEIVDNPELGYLPVKADVIDGDLIVRGNPKIVKLNSSYPLYEVTGDIELSDLSGWKSFWGFGNLNKIQGDLKIKNCGTDSFYGFHNVDTIIGNLHIEDNSVLEKLEFLYRLNAVFGQIKIANNNLLKDISDLDFLQYDDIGRFNSENYDVLLQENKSLQVCNTELFCRLAMDMDKTFLIENNGEGCLDTEQVNQSCLNNAEKLESKALFRLSPNPVKDILSIFLEKSIQIRILTPDGQIWFDKLLDAGQHPIDLSSIPPGLLMVDTGNGSLQKIIKL
jgi:hypothetical protein